MKHVYLPEQAQWSGYITLYSHSDGFEFDPQSDPCADLSAHRFRHSLFTEDKILGV
jgi:hypothetical protein